MADNSNAKPKSKLTRKVRFKRSVSQPSYDETDDEKVSERYEPSPAPELPFVLGAFVCRRGTMFWLNENEWRNGPVLCSNNKPVDLSYNSSFIQLGCGAMVVDSCYDKAFLTENVIKGSWRSISPPSRKRSGETPVLVGSGVLLVGGYDPTPGQGCVSLPWVDWFPLNDEVWTEMPSLPIPTKFPAVAEISNMNMVVAIGGRSVDGTALRCLQWMQDDGTWTAEENFLDEGEESVSACEYQGQVYVCLKSGLFRLVHRRHAFSLRKMGPSPGISTSMVGINDTLAIASEQKVMLFGGCNAQYEFLAEFPIRERFMRTFLFAISGDCCVPELQKKSVIHVAVVCTNTASDEIVRMFILGSQQWDSQHMWFCNGQPIELSATPSFVQTKYGTMLIDPRKGKAYFTNNVMNAEWLPAPAPFRIRSGARAVASGDVVYLVGGYETKDERLSVPWVEKYDFGTERWTELDPLPHPTKKCAVCVCRDYLVVVGGRTDDNSQLRCLQWMDKQQRWHVIDDFLDTGCSSISAFTHFEKTFLCLPKGMFLLEFTGYGFYLTHAGESPGRVETMTSFGESVAMAKGKRVCLYESSTKRIQRIYDLPIDDESITTFLFTDPIGAAKEDSEDDKEET